MGGGDAGEQRVWVPRNEEGEAVEMGLIEVCTARELGGSSSGFERTL